MWHARGKEECLQGFDRNPGGKRHVRRTRDGWEDNIKMDLI
jgi:hypothetical protein